MKLLAKILVNALALYVVAYIMPGFSFESTQSLVVAAVILGVVNAFIKPILQIAALPISIITLGLGAILINVVLLWGVSYVVPGFTIDTFLTAVLSSLLLSLVSMFLNKATS